ncbi:lipoyl(octanoyl) transferase LipB [Kineosporia rhizophila]|uniref:lipoyl(octanoyl) transferase LipB n=1 Tax=Kineosporia TaxID=49184 RepID=UPI001E2E018A|nr:MULTISPECIES: lipoyl(octanoyl) transferase LipB [Kineosporia]MCE0538261.1 lipoyl(octanoyl) transferase LipB [Kineosporia rhizophila]GLY18683.1 octanoyltransferase [Kineosporia sp. NBRC 101677]
MGSLRIEHLGFGADAVEYTAGWARQREVHAEVVAGAPDTVLLLEHQPVYTAGKRTEPQERPVDGTPVVDVDRGGKITWHGPGQLVGYPIVLLAKPVDVVAYVRRLEQMLIDVCAQIGIEGTRVDGRSGVWIPAGGGRPERKVAAIGIRVAQGITMHGFSLTCDSDLGAFGQIIPCGIADAGVTTLSAEAGRTVSVQEILPLVEAALPEYDLPGHHHKRRRPAPKQVATAQPRPIETVSGAIQDLARELSRTN